MGRRVEALVFWLKGVGSRTLGPGKVRILGGLWPFQANIFGEGGRVLQDLRRYAIFGVVKSHQSAGELHQCGVGCLVHGHNSKFDLRVGFRMEAYSMVLLLECSDSSIKGLKWQKELWRIKRD